MRLLDVVREVRRHLEENGRVSLRMLRRQYELDDETLDELIEELVDVQRIARREENVLVWAGAEQGVRSQVSGLGTGPDPRHARPDTLFETRKVISIIFADLMGSTALQERLDPESVNRVMDAYYQAVRGPVEASGGTVVQLLGDGVLCAFGIPQIAQDDALRAVRAAVGIQQAFREFLHTQQWLKVPIGLRVAVNTGEVVVSDEHPAGIGDPLNVAARLQQEARDGEVVIGQATRRLVADAVTLERAGVFALKGRAETVTAYRVVSLERPAGATTAAFVGRDDELARIVAVYDAARTTPAARLAVVLGSPGLGKSRLIEEIGRRLGDASVVTAQCDAAGGATFAPVAEALRTWLGAARADETDRSDPSDPTDPSAALAAVVPEGPDRARIITGITALLAGSPASPEETFFVIRRFLTALAQTKPVVLVIDDLHWAEVVSRWREEVSDELMQDQTFRVEDVLALSPDALLRRTVQSGTIRASGGAFEISSLALSVFGPDGRQTRFELFEIGHEAEALARFDEAATTAGHWENSASRAWREVIAAWRQRDLERFAALQPRPLRYRDHRRLFQLDLDREGFLEFTRPLLTMRSASATLELLATRGERLALMRFTLEMEDEVVGPSAIDSLLLIETDEQRSIAAYDRYELDDLDAAHVELDARWAHGAAVAHPAASKWLADYLRFFAARDWSAMSALFAAEVVGENHRLVGWGTRTGPAGIVSTLQAQIELAPDTRERVDHVRTCAGALLFEYAWHGTREGGAFENLWIVLIELDADGRARRADVWEGEQLEQARARFDEIRASAARDPLAALVKPNAATAAMDRWQAAFESGDWDAMRALGAPGMKIDDRRRQALISYDADTAIADWRQVREAGVRPERHLLGTAGDRIAIERILWTGGAPDARYEVEFVWVIEVDEACRVTASIAFDPDDTHAVRCEAWERWFAIDPAARERVAPTARHRRYSKAYGRGTIMTASASAP